MENPLIAFGFPIILDAAAFLFIPPLACSTGLFADSYTELGYGGEFFTILTTVLLSVAIYTWAMDSVYDMIKEPRRRWRVWLVLLVLNFVYICWSAIACIKSSTFNAQKSFAKGLGSTVFLHPAHLTSVAFHMLKFSSFMYFFFMFSDEELP